MSEERQFNFYTGKLGAINQEIAFREEVNRMLNIPLTNELKKEIRDKVESMKWKDGPYKVSIDKGIEYLGNE